KEYTVYDLMSTVKVKKPSESVEIGNDFSFQEEKKKIHVVTDFNHISESVKRNFNISHADNENEDNNPRSRNQKEEREEVFAEDSFLDQLQSLNLENGNRDSDDELEIDVFQISMPRKHVRSQETMIEVDEDEKKNPESKFSIKAD